MRRKWHACGLAIIIVLLLGACASPDPMQSPLEQVSPLAASPVGTPASAEPAQVVSFSLEKPIVEGTDVVRGTGVPGVPVIITNISFMGKRLGAGVVDSDGRFAIQVPALEKNLFVGLQVGDLSATQWQPEDFYGMEYRGDGAMQVPQVGFFHDTTTVAEK